MPESTEAEPRLDSVEIKVTFSAARAAAAAEALAPGDGGTRRRVHFCELPSGSGESGALPLLDGGVILRLRAESDRHGAGRHDGGDRHGDGDQRGDGERRGGGDSTVKLRPCRRARIGPRWLRFRKDGPDELRIESDWSTENEVLAASLTTDCGRSTVDAVTSGARPPLTAFSRRQQEFLAECADVAVDFRALRVLGPVHAVRWRGVRLSHHELALEHWALDAHGLEWFEVSERVDPEGAEVVQASLHTLVRSLGLEPDLEQETKTRRVLEALTRSSLAR
ncbi:hypothetical protein [Streptomyces sp. NPDC053542]|uniref:hypothetical protein n=1 Tax=Streptomyces sp. NPDC053542 TaxID=3365710 RepID=UPI0037D71A08